MCGLICDAISCCDTGRLYDKIVIKNQRYVIIIIIIIIIMIIIRNLYSAIMPLGGYRGAGRTGR